MSRGSAGISVVLVWCAMIAGTGVEVHAQSGELLAEEPAGIVPIEGESRLRIADVRGEILVRVGKDDELRFLSTVLGSPREETPIALSRDDDTFWLYPTTGNAGDTRRLEVSVPARFWVAVETADSKVVVTAVDGRVEVRGARLDTRLGGLGDSAEVELTGGSLAVSGIEGGL
ncbi:MAG: hypothetical protein R3344_11005, partial [Acidobacteriota bacterium]|nr:hypothetical protein [Acidobacteriota bacterium]